MDVRQLRYIIKISEEKSFSKAAQKLYIAQPSLSQYIKKLEEKLGVELFDRSTKPLKLTYAGELYIKTAKDILNLENQLSQELEDIEHLEKGRLIIGLSTYKSTYIMPKVLPEFHNRFPGIEVILKEGPSMKIENFALKGETDISITNLPIDINTFHYEPILSEKILVAVPPNFPIERKFCKTATNMKYPEINLNTLKDKPFVLLKQHQKLHQIALSLCKESGFYPKIILETENIEAAHAYASSGIGATFIPDTVARFSQTSNHPLYFSIKNSKPTRMLVIAYVKKRYIPKIAYEFINTMKQVYSSSS